MDFVKKKKMWKEVCEMKSLLGHSTSDSGATLAGHRRKMRSLACICSPAASAIPSLLQSGSSCLVYFLVFVFYLAKNRETKKVSLYLFQLSTFFFCIWFPLVMILFVPPDLSLLLPFSVRAFPCVLESWGGVRYP